MKRHIRIRKNITAFQNSLGGRRVFESRREKENRESSKTSKKRKGRGIGHGEITIEERTVAIFQRGERSAWVRKGSQGARRRKKRRKKNSGRSQMEQSTAAAPGRGLLPPAIGEGSCKPGQSKGKKRRPSMEAEKAGIFSTKGENFSTTERPF